MLCSWKVTRMFQAPQVERMRWEGDQALGEGWRPWAPMELCESGGVCVELFSCRLIRLGHGVMGTPEMLMKDACENSPAAQNRAPVLAPGGREVQLPGITPTWKLSSKHLHLSEVPFPASWSPALACLFIRHKLLVQSDDLMFTVASEGFWSLTGTYSSLIKPGPKFAWYELMYLGSGTVPPNGSRWPHEVQIQPKINSDRNFNS